MKLAISVAEWLLGRQNVTATTPVTVQIGRRTYSAVKYTETSRGFDETRLYVLGTLLPLHDKMRRSCYRIDDTHYDWHLIAWFRQRTACVEWQEVHPFGSHFILSQWSPVENWAADQVEKKPFRRTPMTIMEIGPADPNEPTEETDDDRSDAVVFRRWQNGDVIALFPELPADLYGEYCDAYEHVGQHGGADFFGVIQKTTRVLSTMLRTSPSS